MSYNDIDDGSSLYADSNTSGHRNSYRNSAANCHTVEHSNSSIAGSGLCNVPGLRAMGCLCRSCGRHRISRTG